MRIKNPLQINDWPILEFLLAVFSIQIILWLLEIPHAPGWELLVLKQFFGIIYLTYLPGNIILRLLGLHKLGNIKTLLFSSGLSIAFVMFVGLFCNNIYPHFGILKPIESLPLLITMTVFIFLLSLLAFLLDRKFADPEYLNIKSLLSPPALALCIIPFISIFGTYIDTINGDNRVLLFLMVVIAIVALSLGFLKNIPKYVYPLAIFTIALSLIFHYSLMTSYIFGGDVLQEYYVSNLVITNGIWNSNIPLAYNTSLFLTMYTSSCSIVSGLSLTWVFKVICPALLTLIPLCLYCVYKDGTNEKIAFFACFIFVAASAFYVHMPQLTKQIAATIFLTLIIMLLTDKQVARTKKAILIIIFIMSMVVSHYATSYIFIGYLILVWLILLISNKTYYQKLGRYFRRIFSGTNRQSLNNQVNPIPPVAIEQSVGIDLVIFSIIITLTWYIYTAGSSAFGALVHVFYNFKQNVLTDVINPQWIQSVLATPSHEYPAVHLLESAVNRGCQLFVIIGIIALLVKPKETHFGKPYMIFSLVSFPIFLGCQSFPFINSLLKLPLAGGFDLSRLYQITLLFLAPFMVIGGITALKIAGKVIRFSFMQSVVKNWAMLVSVFLAMFFLFQVGFIWSTVTGSSPSRVLSLRWTNENGTELDKAQTYDAFLFKQDVLSSEWFDNHTSTLKEIYATYVGGKVGSLTSYGMTPYENVLPLTEKLVNIDKNAYIYLQYLNVVDGIGAEFNTNKPADLRISVYDISLNNHLWDDMNEIYSNGGSAIYK